MRRHDVHWRHNRVALPYEGALIEGLSEEVRDVVEGRHPLDIDDLVVGVLANLQMPTGDVPALMRDFALLGELDGTLVVDPKRGGLELWEAKIAKDLADVDSLSRSESVV